MLDDRGDWRDHVCANRTSSRFTQAGRSRPIETFADQGGESRFRTSGLFEQVQQRTRRIISSPWRDLRAAQDRLVQTEKLASLGQLTAGIAHEIKNPLNFVNNFASLSAELTDELNEFLKPAPSTTKSARRSMKSLHILKDNLQKVVQHGKRADSIVKNMLLHSREGSGEHRPADINALVRKASTLPIMAPAPRSASSTSPCSAILTRWPARSRCSRRKSSASSLT